MKRYLDVSGVVILLFILFVASLPQVNGFFFPTASDVNSTPAETRSGAMVTSRLGVSSEQTTVPTVPAQASPTSQSARPSPTSQPAQASPTRVAPSPTATSVPSRPASSGSKFIALQAGHWKYQEAPAPLNRQTGTRGGGKTEPEVTLAIANETARILRSWGHTVEILPTNIPSGYKADLVVSIHCDGNTSPTPRGFFTDSPAGSPVAAAEARLSAAIDAEYAKATGIPYVKRSTPGSRSYYGYSLVQASVPMVLIETGFLTNPLDQEILINQQARSAEGIANGIRQYLSQ